MYHMFIIPLREKQTTKEKQTNKQKSSCSSVHRFSNMRRLLCPPTLYSPSSSPILGQLSICLTESAVCVFFFLFVVVAFMASAVSMHLRETKGDGIEDNTHTQGCQNRPIEPNGYRAIKVLKLKTKKEKEDVFIFIVLSFF